MRSGSDYAISIAAVRLSGKCGKSSQCDYAVPAARSRSATSASCSPERDGVPHTPDRAGTVVSKTVRPSAIVGCASITSRNTVYGYFPSMAVCTTAIISPASALKAVNPRISSLSALMRAFRKPRVCEIVAVRRTFIIGMVASR